MLGFCLQYLALKRSSCVTEPFSRPSAIPILFNTCKDNVSSVFVVHIGIVNPYLHVVVNLEGVVKVEEVLHLVVADGAVDDSLLACVDDDEGQLDGAVQQKKNKI